MYEDEPRIVIGATMAWGAVMGVLASHRRPPPAARRPPFMALTFRRSSLAGVVVPLVAGLLMLAGPLLLLRWRRFNDVLDGATFGSASAVAFVGAKLLGRLCLDVERRPAARWRPRPVGDQDHLARHRRAGDRGGCGWCRGCRLLAALSRAGGGSQRAWPGRHADHGQPGRRCLAGGGRPGPRRARSGVDPAGRAGGGRHRPALAARGHPLWPAAKRRARWRSDRPCAAPTVARRRLITPSAETAASRWPPCRGARGRVSAPRPPRRQLRPSRASA